MPTARAEPIGGPLRSSVGLVGPSWLAGRYLQAEAAADASTRAAEPFWCFRSAVYILSRLGKTPAEREPWSRFPEMSDGLNEGVVGDTAKLMMHRLIGRMLRRDPSLVEKAKIAHSRQVDQFAAGLSCASGRSCWRYRQRNLQRS